MNDPKTRADLLKYVTHRVVSFDTYDSARPAGEVLKNMKAATYAVSAHPIAGDPPPPTKVCSQCAKSHRMKVAGLTGSFAPIKCEICLEGNASLIAAAYVPQFEYAYFDGKLYRAEIRDGCAKFEDLPTLPAGSVVEVAPSNNPALTVEEFLALGAFATPDVSILIPGDPID